eukprot:TRINITY_DN40186_c0_g1_i1.p1 TRINITY_DN40186_c0_g1~~TRINITY_DN40186_c0_g1_i1.p1  ORF type:complete len:663 (-),score=96.15 TRINITY_DN40186_c0_g1_i1:1251-3239(-)
MRRHRACRGMLHVLRRLETGSLSCNAFRRATYSALVPASTFIHVQSVPNLYFRRFTACGQYLIALDANNHLIVFRFETGGRRTQSIPSARASRLDLYDTSAFPPPSSLQPDVHISAWPSPSTSLLLSVPVPLAASAPQQPQSPSPVQNPPSYTCQFAQFFTHMYTMSLASGAAHIARDFSMSTTSGRFLILASYQTHNQPPHQPAQPNQLPAIASLPSMTITFYLIEVSTGIIADRFILLDDYVKFASHEGIHFYADMLCILSVRHQVLHIVKIQEALGKFTEERCIGAMCDRDDHQVIASAREAQSAYVAEQKQKNQSRSGQPAASHQPHSSQRDPDAQDAAADAVQEHDDDAEQNEPKETGLGNGKLLDAFYVGLMQRLLAYVYRRMHSEGNASLFYHMIEHYSSLVMRKAQFLDDDHLLIRLGSSNGSEHGVQQQSMLGRETCFFVVYCMSTTRIINLFENRSIQLLRIFHTYRDAFVGDEMEAASLPPLRNSVLDGDQDVEEQNRDGNDTRRDDVDERTDWLLNAASRRGTYERVRRIRLELSRIPMSRQVRMVSPYLDRSLFSYNAERSNVLNARRFASAKDLGSIKFMSAETGELRFKLATEFSLLDGEVGGERYTAEMEEGGPRRRMFLFHPLLPFVMAMEGHRPVNFHVYGHTG